MKLFTPFLLAGALIAGIAFADDKVPPLPPTPPTSPTPPTPPTSPVPPPAPPAPRPPTPPMPPKPPKLPRVPRAGGSGVSVSIHDGKVEIDGVKEMVDAQLKTALESLNHANLPPDVRAKLEQRLSKVRATLDKRMANMKSTDLDQLGDEMGKMGDEIGKEMEDFGHDMEKWGDKFGKDFGKQWNHGSGHVHGNMHDDDDDDDLSSIPDIEDQDDLDDAVRNLGDLSLKPPQREAIAKLRTDSDKQVAAAKQALDKASEALHKQLDNPATSDADIAKSIDAVAQQEAAIRKARILAWHGARRVLDDAQRKKIEGAANKPK